MFNNNNILGANFGFDGSVQATNGEPSTSASQASGSSLDVMLAGLSATEIEEWWLGPGQNGSVGPYTGSTLLDSDEELSGGSGSQTESTPNSNASESHRSLFSVVNAMFNADNSRRRTSQVLRPSRA